MSTFNWCKISEEDAEKTLLCAPRCFPGWWWNPRDTRNRGLGEFPDLGALQDARRVLSFTRTLVSVRDLVDQFHKVVFDGDGVLVESEDGRIRTRIGLPTSNRLYPFDGKALSRHAAAVEAR